LTSGTYTDINFDINRYSNSYTHTPGTAIFTVSSTGFYLIIYKINSNATAKSYTTSQLLSNTSGSYIVIPGSICQTYHNDANNNDGSGTIATVVSLNSGNSIKLQSQGNIANVALEDGTSIYISCLKSSNNNQTNIKYFNAYNTTALTYPNNGVYIDLTLQNTTTTNSIYSFTNNSATVTLNETGKYLVIHNTSVNNAGTATNRQDSIQTRLIVDKGTGAGFIDVPATSTSCFVGASTNYKATSISFSIINMTSGSTIKLQSVKFVNNSISTTIPNGSSLTLIKLDTPPTLGTIVPVILNYGTYYDFVVNKATSATTSTVYQQKLLLSTKQIPAGVYRIETSYQVAQIAQTIDLYVRVTVDSTNVIHEQAISYSALFTLVTKDYDHVTLTAGFHDISIRICCINSTTYFYFYKIFIIKSS
jgi:multisubunit Na+/H+ antiporter MnhE subunit